MIEVISPQQWFYLFAVSASLVDPAKPAARVEIPFQYWVRWHHGYLQHGCTPRQTVDEALEAVRGALFESASRVA